MFKSLNDEHIAIVNNCKTLLSVRSGNGSLDEFPLNEINDLMIFLLPTR